jgi:hypothetical protein
MVLGGATLALLIAAAPVGASCGDDAKNLLAKRNCGFEIDVEGWEGLETTVVHEAGQGSPPPGALSATAADGFVLVLSPCVKIKGRASYRVSAQVRVVSGEVHACTVAARQSTDGACEEDSVLETTAQVLSPGDHQAVAVLGADWQIAEGVATAARESKSARLHLECNGEGAFHVMFDDVVLAPQ